MITSIGTTHFKLKFKSPMKVGEKSLHQREGYYLNLKTDTNQATAELSPLVGLHKESLKESIDQIEEITLEILNQSIILEEFNLESPCFGLIKLSNWDTLYPSTQFAIEMGLFYLYKDLFPKEFFNTSSIKNNSLYIPQNSNTLRNSERLKIKIGRQSLEDDKLITDNILKQAPIDCLIRLDGNRSFSTKDLLELIKDLDHSRIEYLEEPLKDGENFEPIFNKYQIPLALDESLSLALETDDLPKYVKTWVLKPALWGASRSISLIHKASQMGFNVVISSCFEGPRGIDFLGHLASYQNSFNPTYSGLNTLEFFEEY